MKNRVTVCAILVVLAVTAGCGKRNTLGLDVDLYLHPTSADPLDIILQTAITKQLNESKVTKSSLIHVRVEGQAVTLTGTASDASRKEAQRIAEKTDITLNTLNATEHIRPKTVTNRIDTN